jgi:fucose 4-O-acetylase-like acetyltransferase
MKQRFKHLDCIRCFAVFWVLIVHISLNYGKLKFGVCSEKVDVFTLLSFYMVPFYIISGYFFNVKKNFHSFVLNKIKKLLIPYMTFTFFGLLIFEVFSLVDKGGIDLPSIRSFIPTAALPSNTPCWFFISLFCVNMAYYFISKRNSWQRHLIIIICFLFAFLTNGRTQIFGYGNVFLGLVYFHIGTLFKEYEPYIRKKRVFLFAVCLYVLISIFDPQRLSFVLNLQVCGLYVLNLLFSLAAMVICWNIASLWKYEGFIGRNICFIGQNSLVLFASHRPILNYIIQPVLNHFIPNLGYPFFLIIAFILILVFYYVLNFVGKKFFPFLLGA